MELIIFTRQILSTADSRIKKLSRFYGVDPVFISVDQKKYLNERINDSWCAAISIRTFTILFQDQPSFYKLVGENRAFFIYPEEDEREDEKTIRKFSKLTGCDFNYYRPKNHVKRFEDTPITGTLSSLEVRSACAWNSMSLRKPSNITPIIQVEGAPSFFQKKVGGCKLYICGFPIADIDMAVSGPISLRDQMDGYIPYVMFLKYNLKQRIWHNQRTYANLIIDDPHLRRKYGYINFRKFCHASFAAGIKTTIAFVPINYKKTNDSTLELFKQHNNFDICIHGCGHTSGEFGTKDYDVALNKALIARNLMSKFSIKTGIVPVMCMVFPQGSYSNNALKALKDANYIAAINSHYNNNDADQDTTLTLKDFLTPAVVARFGFPLYHRRILSSESIHIRLSAFLNKPIFFVQHHSDFRDGYGHIVKTANELSRMIKRIQWTSLHKILTECHWRKMNSDESISIWLFSRKAKIINKSSKSKVFKTSYIEQNQKRIDFKILVDGKPVPFSTEHERVSFEIELKPKSSALISIQYNCKESDLVQLPKVEMFSARLRAFVSDLRAAVLPLFKI